MRWTQDEENIMFTVIYLVETAIYPHFIRNNYLPI